MTVETAERVLEVAKRLFAERGFDGVSVREICASAGVSDNAVHYHFGSKDGLYQAILSGLLGDRLASADRILGCDAASIEELKLRLELFCEETLVALLAERHVLVIALDEMAQGFRRGGREIASVIGKHERYLSDFLTAAKLRGFIREDVDVDIVAGTLLERVSTQARYVEFHQQLWGTTPEDVDYRRHWVRQLVGLCLFGVAETNQTKEGD